MWFETIDLIIFAGYALLNNIKSNENEYYNLLKYDYTKHILRNINLGMFSNQWVNIYS